MAGESGSRERIQQAGRPQGQAGDDVDVVWLSQLAARLARSPADADDLVQRASLELLEKPQSEVKNYRPWVFGMMRNLERTRTISDYRRARRERNAKAPAASVPPEEVLGAEETRAILATATDTLPEPYRETIRLRYYEGASSAEIARQRGVPSATVRSHLKRGLDLLRRDLESRIGPEWRASCLLVACVGGFAEGGAAVQRSTLGSGAGSKGLIAGLLGVAGLVAWMLVPTVFPSAEQLPESDSAAVAVAERAEVQPGETAAHRSDLAPFRRVSVRGVDAETGAPIWPISATGPGVEGVSEAPTATGDASGLALSIRGETVVSISAEGYLAADVTIGASSRDAVVVPLRKDAVFRMEIVQPEIHPEAAGRFVVAAWRLDQPTPDLTRPGEAAGVTYAVADESGRLELRGLQAGMQYRFVGAGGGFVLPQVFHTIVPGGQSFPLELQRVYGVRLVPQEGPVGPAVPTGSLRCIEPSSVWTPDGLGETLVLPGSPTRQLLISTLDEVLDERLAFELTYLCGRPLGQDKAQAPYCLRLPGYAVRMGVAPVRPVIDRVHREPVIVERVASGFGSIRVRVTPPAVWGEVGVVPEIGARLILEGHHANGDRFSMIADLDGRCVDGTTLDYVPAGEYEVSLLGPGGLGARPGGIPPIATGRCVVKGDNTAHLRFDLSGHGALRIVVGQDANFFSGSTVVSLLGRSTEGVETSVDWSGAPYDIWALPEDDYEIRIPATHSGSSSTLDMDGLVFSIRAGELTEVSLSIPSR